MSRKGLTPKQAIQNQLQNARNISEEMEKKMRKELQNLDEEIARVTKALPDAPEFKRLQAELIENKKTALSSHERLQNNLSAHLQRKRIYLRLLNLKADIAKDFAPFVNKSNDSENLTNPYQYRRKLIAEMLDYATLIRHIQVEISACVQLAADIFRENSPDDKLKIAEVEVDAIRNLLLKKVADGFLPPDSKWDSQDSVKKFLAPEDFEAIENYLKTLKYKETIFEEFIKLIPENSEIQSISEQIKFFYQGCQDAIFLAAKAYDNIPNLQSNYLAVQSAKLQQKNQEARSRAAKIIRDNPQVSAKIKTLKLSIQNYLDYSKGVLKPSDKDNVNDIELKIMNWNDSRDWVTPYNLISQLSRFLQAITHEKVAEIKKGPGSSPPWPLVWKRALAYIEKKRQVA